MRVSVLIKGVLLSLALVMTPLVAQAEEPVWIDVRTQAEYQQDHIEGDPLMPHKNIVAQVTEQFPDKDTEIRLYCRSGNRAGIAKSALEEAGYTNVKNMGGIDDARKTRGL